MSSKSNPRKLLFLSFFVFQFLVGFAQNPNAPTFDTFEGTIYKIPARQITKGYQKDVVNFREIGKISLPRLNISERPDTMIIPEVGISNGFGIIFTNQIHISKSAVYKFSLSSDDGSRLWIGNKSIINHDGVHKMEEKVDSVYIEKGSYPMKIWYFQGIPDRYGIIFKADYLKDGKDAEKELLSENLPEESMTFSEKELKFETNSSIVNESGIVLLEKLSADLQSKKIKKITITGHTDSKGSESFNQQLSSERALAVQKIIQKKLTNLSVQFSIIGMGESQAIDSNETEEGRSKNRRVEIKIEYVD